MQPHTITNEITVQLKTVYGNQLVYPVCHRAVLFAALIGKKTFTVADLKIIHKLGFGINFDTTLATLETDLYINNHKEQHNGNTTRDYR